MNLTWNQLGKRVNLNSHYLQNELRNEQKLISEELFNHLLSLTKKDYSCFIAEKLADNWGRSKGGKNSKGNTKVISPSKKNIYLAELIGIILGDGHVEKRVNDTTRCYTLKIAGHIKNDCAYLSYYVSNLIKQIYGEFPSIRKDANYGVMWAVLHGRGVVEDLTNKGLGTGNKKKNNQGIPDWIKENKSFLKVCLRGLIDTDGSIHRISKKNKNLRICFTSYIPQLLSDAREAFICAEYFPSKIIKDNQFFITRKENIARYVKEIGFANEKHLKRLERLGS